MSYYVTNENSFLDIKNAHLRVTGNVHTDVLKVGSIGFQPAGSNISGTVNFTNVTTGVTTTSNLDVGGTLNLGTIELSASTHTLDHITARGNVTSTTVQFDNTHTSLVTSGNVEVGGELTVSGDVNVEGRVLSGHASGGNESVVDGYKIHTFTSSSNFNVVTPGVVEYLIIGGGGGGGGTHGAGGGGGGFIQGHTLVKSGLHSIVVGGGGTGSTAQGANGVNSTAFGLTAVGGGGGGRGYDATYSTSGSVGGSSGGSGPFVLTGPDSRDFGKVPEKVYTNRYQGNGGGGGNNTSGAGHGGGGGGAGGAGGNATTTSNYYAGNGISGVGGLGLVSYITGSPVIYAGGGSGGRWAGTQSINVQGGVGGTNGGGGIGGASGASGMAATAGGINTGGGGGGGSDNGGRGGNGGSGIVILRYPV